MIAASRKLWALALAAAVAFHAALGWALIAVVDVKIESSAGAREARIGTSFTDMAAGTLQPQEAGGIAEAETSDMSELVEPMTPAATRPVETVESISAIAPEGAEGTIPAIAALPPETSTSKTSVKPAPPSPRPDAVTAQIADEVVSGDADAAPAIAQSLRPKRRSAAFEKKNHRATKTIAPKAKPQPKKQPRGNAEQNSRAGTVAGSTTGKAATSGVTRGNAAESGNAAASNYPGLVMRRIARVPRPRAGSRGTVVVTFSVSGNGGLAGVSVARSSGSGALDRAAVRMIQSAAPFPAPPPGAQRRFSISVEGR